MLFVIYKLASWLGSLLKSLVGNISKPHIKKNSEDFIVKISREDLKNVVSYDGVSLLTIVPVDTTLIWLEECINKDNLECCLVPIRKIKELIKLSMDYSYFHFNDSFFKTKIWFKHWLSPFSYFKQHLWNILKLNFKLSYIVPKCKMISLSR